MSASSVTLRRLDLSRADVDAAVAAEIRALLRRGAVPDQRVREGARAILASVKIGGDAAVRGANERFGGGRADGSLLVSRAEMEAARDALPARIRAGLDQMIANIRRFAETQKPQTRTTVIVTVSPGCFDSTASRKSSAVLIGRPSTATIKSAEATLSVW